ncbi:PKD domain-containing protein [Lentzea sp. NPDC051838]|uniref:PKD domain-containing protein n=1 Tax=Lentzea sp. NPDC051838 TaxID=3154849 RepID=UPI003445311E
MKRRHHRAAAALASAAAVAAAVLVVGPGYETSQVRMHSGTAWLASGRAGEVTLVDGSAAEVKAHVPIAEAGAALSVARQDGSAYVLNTKTGGLSRVDSATERASPPTAVLPASDGLAVLSAPGALYAIDVHSGLVAEFDPATMTTRGEPEKLAEEIRPYNVVVDARSTLWTVDDASGELVWLTNGERRARAIAAKNGRLTITDGKPALVDVEHGTAELLNPATGNVARSVRLEPRASGRVAVSGSADRSRLLIAADGELVTCAFDTGCATPVKISSADADLGAPVEVGNHAVVPDHTTGQATIVDLAGSRVLAQRQLFDAPTRFELISQDGIVFFNDPSGSTAGVLDLSGDVRTITKYTEDQVPDKIPPTPDQPARADQATKTDPAKPAIGLSLPGDTDPSASVNTTPNPVASIVVKPGHRGVVGAEFELMLATAGKATAQWAFGDGIEASGTSVRHSWQQQGVYTVRAAVTFDTGARIETTTTVTVDPPEAPPSITALTFRRPKPVMGESVHFNAETTRKPDRWEWTVTKPGEPTPEATSQAAEFDHRFPSAGTYTVSLTITTGAHTVQSSRQLKVGRGWPRAWGNPQHKRLEIPQTAWGGVVAVQAANRHVLALMANGSVIGWGSDSFRKYWQPPTDVSSDVIAIAAMGDHSLALKANGSVIAWGDNTYEQAKVPEAALHDVVAIAAGNWHSLALKSDGTVIGWGGRPGEDKADVPPNARSGVVAITAGRYMSQALKADGSIVTWGRINGRQADIPPEATSGVRALAAGSVYCLALKNDGSIVGWGSSIIVPPIPDEAKHGVVAMAYTMDHALVLKEDGTAFGFGGNNHFDEITVPRIYSTGVLAIAAGINYSIVVTE